MVKRVLRWVFLAIIVLLGVIQFIPYGHSHTNPPVRVEPSWDSANTRDLAVRACFNCHSNETEWPWYSNVAPVSWVVQSHVEEGRRKMNFSEWEQSQEDIEEITEVITNGEMPPWDYLVIHPEARLSASERDALLRGFARSIP